MGTSGWSYPHWRNVFYPPQLPQNAWIGHYAQAFDTVELNASFYRLPSPDTVDRWRRLTPPGFSFAVKMSRLVTHVHRLRNCDEPLRAFFTVMDRFGPRRGPVLVQLPPSLSTDAALLDDFLAQLGSAWTKRWQVAVEFRHASWLTPAVYRVADRHGAAVCLADLPSCPIVEPNAAPLLYVRRHGPEGRYRGCYSDQHIRADAARICDWLTQKRRVYVYYNNDVDGHAVANAASLRQAVLDMLATRRPGRTRS